MLFVLASPMSWCLRLGDRCGQRLLALGAREGARDFELYSNKAKNLIDGCV